MKVLIIFLLYYVLKSNFGYSVEPLCPELLNNSPPYPTLNIFRFQLVHLLYSLYSIQNYLFQLKEKQFCNNINL